MGIEIIEPARALDICPGLALFLLKYEGHLELALASAVSDDPEVNADVALELFWNRAQCAEENFNANANAVAKSADLKNRLWFYFFVRAIRRKALMS